ncbi:MAG: hypothetical protein LBS52_01315, partial [Dysgonamonadaceae bacterium]|nr:hypothetical protein [Dysgonamonadaceae bacterium]
LSACNEDKGNYDYIDINRVDSIQNISGNYSVYLGYRLQINPRLVYSQGSNENDFEYKWYYYESSTWKLLQEGLNFDQEIAPPIGKNRTIAFEAYNTKTGARYLRTFTITLSNPKGYAALCETSSGFDIYMASYLPTDDIFAFSPNVLEGSDIPHTNGEKPIDIVTATCYIPLAPTQFSPDEDEASRKYFVYILTDQYTTAVSSKDFAWKPDYKIESVIEGGSYLDVNYKQQSKPIIAQKIKMTDASGRMVHMYQVDKETGKGNWFMYTIYPLVRLFCNPLNVSFKKDGNNNLPDESKRFEPSPYSYVWGMNSPIIWDKDNKKFNLVLIKNHPSDYSFYNAFFSIPFVNGPTGGEFSFTDPDFKDLVYMGETFENATNPNGFAVMELNSGGYRFIRFGGLVGTAMTTASQTTYTPPAMTRARDKASKFAASSRIGSAKFVEVYPNSTFLYYVTNDNKVFKADVSGATAIETEITNLFVKDGYTEITAFEFPLPDTQGGGDCPSSLEKGLAVGTINPSKPKDECGKLEIFTLVDGSLNGSLELAKYPTDAQVTAKPELAEKQRTMSFTGMAKIVGLDYKKK